MKRTTIKYILAACALLIVIGLLCSQDLALLFNGFSLNTQTITEYTDRDGVERKALLTSDDNSPALVLLENFFPVYGSSGIQTVLTNRLSRLDPYSLDFPGILALAQKRQSYFRPRMALRLCLQQRKGNSESGPGTSPPGRCSRYLAAGRKLLYPHHYLL